MANFVLPRSQIPKPARKHKLPDEELQNKENNPAQKRFKSDITSLRTNREPLLDKKNISPETAMKLLINKNVQTEKKLPQASRSSSLIPKNQILCRRSVRFSIQNRWGCISPISENKHAPLAVVINQGIPDGRQKLSKKNTLCRGNAVLHRQGMIEEYFDDFYDTDLLMDVIRYQLHVEQKCALKTTLQKFGACLSSRSAVINWLIQVQEYLNLPNHEIFTTVYLFDMVISNTKVAINMYQLVGLTILWIISKSDDIVNSQVAPKMLALCKGAYTKQQFLKMEKKLLVFFDFKFNMADVTVFVVFYMKKLEIDNVCFKVLLNCAYYVLECFTLHKMYSTKLPSVKAAAAVSLVTNILQPRCPKVWDLLKSAEFCQLEDIHILENEMLMQVQIIQDPHFTFRQSYVKYASAKYCQASIIILQSLVGS